MRARPRPSGPGAKTSLDSTRPSTPLTSRTLVDQPAQRAAARRSRCAARGRPRSRSRRRSASWRGLDGQPLGAPGWRRWQIRLKTSSEEFAWIVDSEPSLPWVIALSMVTISSPRTSPTMTRRGVHPQRPADQLGHRDRALALGVGQPLLERDHVGVQVGELVEAELQGPLDGDQPLVRRDLVGQRPQQRRLPGVGGAGDHDVLAGPRPRRAGSGRAPAVIVPLPTRSVEEDLAQPGAADRQRGPLRRRP